MSASFENELIAIIHLAPAAGLSAEEILAALAQRGAKISQPTLARRLKKLRESGSIVQRGARRGARYVRDPVSAHFSVPAELRKPVNYNFNLLRDYQPNVDYWLSKARRQRLREAGERIRALPPAQGGTVLERLAIDLSWASSRLEGNTYTLLDTQRLLVEGQAASGHSAQETRMILNHKAALDHLRQHVDDFGPNPRDIFELHSLLASGLLGDDADAGRIRRGLIEISRSAYLPIAPPQQLDEQLQAILEKARAIEDPFEQSIFLLAFIPYLQPFIDVNKRTGRIAANIPLLKHQLCPMSYRDMDKDRYTDGLLAFYELNWTETLAAAYCEAYERGVDRYTAVVEQGRTVNPLEIRYHREIQQCVADYVRAVADGRKDPIVRFAEDWFRHAPAADRAWLAERIGQIVAGLHTGNIVAWRIEQSLWERYDAAPRR